MLNSIHGLVVQKKLDSLFLRCSHYEWQVYLSKFALTQINENEEYRLLIFLRIYQDKFNLYGFLEEKERYLFQELMKIDGIGAKLALKILSQKEHYILLQCIENKDLSTLKQLSGLGEKKAQKILIQLKGKMIFEEMSQTNNFLSQWENDIFFSLTKMGYSKNKVELVLKDLVKKYKIESALSEAEEEIIFQEALKRLM